METQPQPILLFNDECSVCRRIARWVRESAVETSGDRTVSVRPIGDDPVVLRALNPELDIWDAYETIHVLMPDGSMKVGGEAVAEVLRRLPRTRWFAWSFAFGVLGIRPFQLILNLGYAILADSRPIFGCESCGTPSAWMRPIQWLFSPSVVDLVMERNERRLRTSPAGLSAATRPDAARRQRASQRTTTTGTCEWCTQ